MTPNPHIFYFRDWPDFSDLILPQSAQTRLESGVLAPEPLASKIIHDYGKIFCSKTIHSAPTR